MFVLRVPMLRPIVCTNLVDIKPINTIHKHPGVLTQLMRSLPLNMRSWAAVEQGAGGGGKPLVTEQLPSSQVLTLR